MGFESRCGKRGKLGAVGAGSGLDFKMFSNPQAGFRKREGYGRARQTRVRARCPLFLRELRVLLGFIYLLHLGKESFRRGQG